MPTIGDPQGDIQDDITAWQNSPIYRHRQERQPVSEIQQAEALPARSGHFLLAGLMWLSYTASAFLFMFGLILPTWGNVFIVLVFLLTAVVVSFAGAGMKRD